MPGTFLYLLVMLCVITIWFLWLKRPVYEAMLVSFLALLCVTGTWPHALSYIHKGMSTSLLYSMAAFVLMSMLLTETKVMDGCIAVILALLGRIPGGAGYVSVIASTFMGALSGSGPGNVMATGAITIPAMKRSGFPPELAANIESNASYMGNMIPPSSNIVAALGVYMGLYPASGMSSGQFWIILWGISLWFILQRMLMVFLFCRYYRVQPMAKEDIPDLRSAIRENWQGLLLPVIILLPFLLDYLLQDGFLPQRIGETGAAYFSKSILIFIPGIAALYALLICRDKSIVAPRSIAAYLGEHIKSIVPSICVCLFGYMIGALFTDLNVAEEMEAFILSAHMSKFTMVLFIAALTCVLGMIIPGSSLVVMFGPAFVVVLSSTGVDPLLAAGMLPCICGVMCGITPPLGLGMYAGMALADSDFGKTFRNNLWWVAAHFVLEIVVLMGWLPIIGL